MTAANQFRVLEVFFIVRDEKIDRSHANRITDTNRSGMLCANDALPVRVETFDIPLPRTRVVKELFSPIIGNGSWLPHNSCSNGLSAHCHRWREYRRSFDLGLEGFERGLNDFTAQARVKFFG